MNVYEIMSTMSEARARLRSNEGEWISFFIVFGAWVEGLEGVWELESLSLSSRRGVRSPGVVGTGNSRMIGSGLNSLMVTGYKRKASSYTIG